MPDWMDEAKNLASEHSDIADEGFDKAEQFAEQETGGKYDNQLQQGEQKAEDYLGVQDQDSNQQS
jgi:MT0933-like antitoxin protein